MTAAPRVTVLMSVYNGERYLGEAVQSILGQTFRDFEFLIFEDCSTDRSRELLRAVDDPRIRLVENQRNLGLTANLARGMTMARGEYVARMDADDVSLPNRLESQIGFMDGHREVGLLGSAVTFFDGAGWEFLAYQPSEHEAIKCTLFLGYTMLHPSVMMRRGEFERHELSYDEAFRVSQDHELWVRASRVTRLANLLEPLVRMRLHAGSVGARRKPEQIRLSDTVRRRQFDELRLPVKDSELALFNALTYPGYPWVRGEFRIVDELLMAIHAANRSTRVFDQARLESMSAELFRDACRNALRLGRNAGLWYWRSRMRALDSPSARQITGMAYRSLASAFDLGRGRTSEGPS